MIIFSLTFVTSFWNFTFEDFSIIKNLICIEINLCIFSGRFWKFLIIKLFFLIPPSCLRDFRKNWNTMFMRDGSASALTTFNFWRALCASIFYLSPFFIYFTYLLVKAHAFIFYFHYVLIFYVIFTCLTSI